MNIEQRILDFLATRRWAPTATVKAALGVGDVQHVLGEMRNKGRVHSAPVLTAREDTCAVLWGVAPIPRMSVADYMVNDPDRDVLPAAELARRYGVSRQYAHTLGVGRPRPPTPRPPKSERGLSPGAKRVREILTVLDERPMTSGEIVARVWPAATCTAERQRYAKACCWTLRRQWAIGRVEPMDVRDTRGRITRLWRRA